MHSAAAVPDPAAQVPASGGSPARRLASSTLAGVVGLSFCSNLLLLTVPIFMLQIYDRVLASGSVETLVMLALLAAVMICGYGLLDWSVRRTLGALAISLERLFLPVSLRYDLADTQQRATTEIRRLRSVLSGPRPAWFIELLWVPLFTAILFFVHPLLGVVALVGIAILLVLTVLTDRNVSRASSELEATADRSNGVWRALIADRAAILSGLDGRDRLSSYEDYAADTLERQRDVNRIQAMSVSTARSVRQLLQIALLGLGAWLALQGAISAGAIVAASILMTRALAPVENSLASWRSVRRAWEAFRYLDSLVVAPIGLVQPRQTGRWKLRVDKLFYRVPGREAWLLRNLGFELAPGDLLVVAGMVGSGKTSLLELIAGVRAPTLGSVDFTVEGGGGAWPGVGFVGQEPTIYPGTLAENIAGVRGADSALCRHALEQAGVADLIENAGLTLDSEIGEPARLSRGQRQAIGLARAFYREPPVLILDEPTAPLDARNEIAVAHAIADLRTRGAIVVAATHSDRIAGLASKLLLLQPGGEHEFFSGWKQLRARLSSRSGAAAKAASAKELAAAPAGE